MLVVILTLQIVCYFAGHTDRACEGTIKFSVQHDPSSH
jgi:hypothetical protein